MRRFFVPFYKKQHHTTSLLDATDSMRKLYQQRYWTWWTDEMTSVKETPPHLNCQHWIKPSRTASVCTNGKNGDFVETMDQKTDVTKLWRIIKGIDGRPKREAENEAITFNGISFSSSKQLATKFNQQFNTSKLGRHTSSRETRVVTRVSKRKPLETVRIFTTDLVMKAIKSCRNSKAFGPDKLSIFHLKHLGPMAIEYITTLFNLSATTFRIPAIWKSSLILPIPKPGKETSQGTSYQPISLICPAAKVLESLFLPTINKYFIPAQDQHGFRRQHSTTSALLQLTTDVAIGFDQRKPPGRTICVAVDLSVAFDTVCHNNLLSKITAPSSHYAMALLLSER